MRSLCFLAAFVALVASPAAAHEFVAYFETGRAELSAAGYAMVRSASGYARSEKATRILLVAHMDTAEAAEFSDELGARRAQAVATELVLLGVDPAVIEMRTMGASVLARPTPDNTPEPLNRRVTLGINFLPSR